MLFVFGYDAYIFVLSTTTFMQNNNLTAVLKNFEHLKIQFSIIKL